MVSVLHANFISHWVSFVLRCFYKSNSSCLCRGENSELFCLVELWPCTAYALIVWIHWDFNINAVHASQNTKNNFGFTHASSKVHFCSTEAQTFYWSILTADDSIKCRCANSSMTGQMGGFQNPGVCLQEFRSFHPHPLPTLLLVPFFVRSLIYSSSSFFAPKPHGNACYGGYLVCPVTKY